MSAPAVKPRHVFYLHGFASSPKSTKVGYFTDRLLEHGILVRCPDFNEPDFTTMTLTRMVDRLGGELAALGAGGIVKERQRAAPLPLLDALRRQQVMARLREHHRGREQYQPFDP